MRIGLLVLECGLAAAFAAHAADPREVWEQAVQAKGGRDRLHSVHALAIYMKPADVKLPGPLTNWLCVFPDRFFEFEGPIAGSERAVVVDGTADRVSLDATGKPRSTGHLTWMERDRLTLNQLVFLLESAWLQPRPVEVRHSVLVVEAAGRMYRLFLNNASLPERILSPPIPGQKPKIRYEYKLERYREFEGVMLPARVAWVGDVREWTWDVDYEIDAKYNPKLFARMPNTADGPEPWRLR
ncbi:MAG: hypothetical protein ABSF64_19030 [Bryobacteraceae bacterium]|jgi:hypothetical protein